MKMPDADTTPEIWIADFKEIKGCSKQTVYNAIARGQLNSIKKFNTTFIINDQAARNWKPDDSKRQEWINKS